MNGGKTILVMEPSTIGRLALGRGLAARGLTVVAAGSVGEAETRLADIPAGELAGVVAAMHAEGRDDAHWLGKFGTAGGLTRVPAIGLSSDTYAVLPEGVCAVVDRRLPPLVQVACLEAWLRPDTEWKARVLVIGGSLLRAKQWERRVEAGGGEMFRIEDFLDAGTVIDTMGRRGRGLAVAVFNAGAQAPMDVLHAWREQMALANGHAIPLIVCPDEEAAAGWAEAAPETLLGDGIVEATPVLTPPWMVAKMRFHATTWRARHAAPAVGVAKAKP